MPQIDEGNYSTLIISVDVDKRTYAAMETDEELTEAVSSHFEDFRRVVERLARTYEAEGLLMDVTEIVPQ